jgi:hypothetical protein
MCRRQPVFELAWQYMPRYAQFTITEKYPPAPRGPIWREVKPIRLSHVQHGVGRLPG